VVAAAVESAPAVLDIGFLLLLAVLAGWLARRLGLPAVIGYLAVGLAVSPFTPGYVADRRQLELLADVGVVLLLFEVGIEINPLALRKESGGLFWAAPVQVLLTTGLCGAIGLAAGLSPAAAIVIGLGVALSSSVVVVNITRSRRRTTNKTTEDALLGWSVLQDITGVAITLVALAFLGLASRPPLLAGALIVAFVLVVVAAAWLLPRALHRLQGEHDLFLMLSVGSGLVLAGAGAAFFGVPLALAAFVAGLAVGESPAAAEARRRILPFRDLFAVLFFVLLGSLIDPRQLVAALPWLAFLLAAVVVLKAAVIWILARLARLRDVSAWQLAVGLGQVGEFSFVLVTLLAARELIQPQLYTAVLAAVVISVVLSTTLVRAGGWRASPFVG
jgi:monovalent cation:H+ antiporter-2, CPA2 family